MSFKAFLKRQNKVHIKILMAFLCLLFLFGAAEVVVSNKRTGRSIAARTLKLLQNHTRLFNEIIRDQEAKVAFYARFMADVTKLSDELSDTSVGRSTLIYVLESLQKERITFRMYRQRTVDREEKRRLIQKGLLGIRTTALLEEGGKGEAELNIAAVAPIERAGGIREVIVAEFPLDLEFLAGLKRKTGADFTLIYQGRLFASTLDLALQDRLLAEIHEKRLQREVLEGGRTIVKEIPDQTNPQKIAFSPLSINFKNQGVYAISQSLRTILTNKKTIVLQNMLIMGVILIGVALLYYIIVKRLTHPIMELSSASKKVAEGNLEVNIAVRTQDEVGELAGSFSRMVGQLKQSQERVRNQIDELSRLYREVSEERNISKSILDNLHAGVILFDPDHKVMLINPTAQEWLGVTEEEALGRQIAGKPESPALEPLYVLGRLRPTEEMIRCWKYFGCDKEQCPAYGSQDLRCWFISGTFCRNEVAKKYPEKLEACRACDVYQAYSSALKREKEVKVEEVELRKPHPRVLKVSLSPVFDDHGKFLGLIEVFHDITREKEIDRLKTEFVSLVSHELRTPLSSIKAYAEILLRRPDRDTTQQVEFLNIINEETDRLTRLINDILNVSKIEERRIDLKRRAVDLYEVIDRSVSAHRSHAQKKGIRLEMDVPRDLPKIWGDEDTLMQVLANLLNNAVKYTPEGGAIRVLATTADGASQSPQMVEVRVKDTGIGIPSEHLDNVFERFYRIDRPLAGGETGTGLGLYFCRYIVERHGGRIWAESEAGEGSTFAFTLPIATMRESLEKPSQGIQADDLIRYPKELRGKISVLIVDDDSKTRRFLRYFLEEEGFTVHEAESGAAALDLVKAVKPSVILLDTVMPGLDGYEVMEALNRNVATRDIPVIVLSGSEDSELAMRLGAAEYLVKPVGRSTLIEAVHEILTQASDSGTTRRVGGLKA